MVITLTSWNDNRKAMNEGSGIKKITRIIHGKRILPHGELNPDISFLVDITGLDSPIEMDYAVLDSPVKFRKTIRRLFPSKFIHKISRETWRQIINRHFSTMKTIELS